MPEKTSMATAALPRALWELGGKAPQHAVGHRCAEGEGLRAAEGVQRISPGTFPKTFTGQQVPETMLHITNYRGNRNEKHSETSPCICDTGYYQEDER